MIVVNVCPCRRCGKPVVWVAESDGSGDEIPLDGRTLGDFGMGDEIEAGLVQATKRHYPQAWDTVCGRRR